MIVTWINKLLCQRRADKDLAAYIKYVQYVERISAAENFCGHDTFMPWGPWVECDQSDYPVGTELAIPYPSSWKLFEITGYTRLTGDVIYDFRVNKRLIAEIAVDNSKYGEYHEHVTSRQKLL